MSLYRVSGEEEEEVVVVVETREVSALQDAVAGWRGMPERVHAPLRESKLSGLKLKAKLRFSPWSRRLPVNCWITAYVCCRTVLDTGRCPPTRGLLTSG